MLCERCGAWSEVKATRSESRGYVVRRDRLCANGHRFRTFEVLGPVYRNDPRRVRDSANAAEARAFRYRRNAQVLYDLKTMTNADVGRKHGLDDNLVCYIKRVWKP